MENVIKKNKKYLWKFPEEMKTSEKAEYIDRVKKRLETDDWVVIDSKINIYPHEDELASQSKPEEKKEEKKEEVKTGEVKNEKQLSNKNEGVPSENTTEPNNKDGKSDIRTKTENTPTETGNERKPENTINIEKVTVSDSKKSVDSALFGEDTIGRQGEDGEE